jgi:hypothetical protein
MYKSVTKETAMSTATAPIVDIKITLDKEVVLNLLKHQKLISFITTSLSNQYLFLHPDKAVVILTNSKSQIEIPLEGVSSPDDNSYSISIDINRFLNALKKLTYSPTTNLRFRVAKKSILTLSSGENSKDRIDLGAEYLDQGNSLVEELTRFIDDQSLIRDDMLPLDALKIPGFLRIANGFLGGNTSNNSFSAEKDAVIYADRTVVVKNEITDLVPGLPPGENIEIHEFTLALLQLVFEHGTVLNLSQNSNYAYWVAEKDSTFRIFLVQEPRAISVPSQAEIDAISPEDSYKKTMIAEKKSLTSALSFFSGMFEASFWKPLTFKYSENEPTLMTLSYEHPNASLEKQLTDVTITGNPLISQVAEFILITDTLKVLLNVLDDEAEVTLEFNDVALDEPHGAGVKLLATTPEGGTFVAVLAKLQDM